MFCLLGAHVVVRVGITSIVGDRNTYSQETRERDTYPVLSAPTYTITTCAPTLQKNTTGDNGTPFIPVNLFQIDSQGCDSVFSGPHSPVPPVGCDGRG